MRRLGILAVAGLALSACATSPTTEGTATPETTRPTGEAFALQPTSFSDIPDWQSIDLAPALLAFRRSCDGRVVMAAQSATGRPHAPRRRASRLAASAVSSKRTSFHTSCAARAKHD